MNHRISFFAGASVVCLVLAPAADAKFRWLPLLLSAVYAVLAVLVGLDALGRRQRR